MEWHIFSHFNQKPFISYVAAYTINPSYSFEKCYLIWSPLIIYDPCAPNYYVAKKMVLLSMQTLDNKRMYVHSQKKKKDNKIMHTWSNLEQTILLT